MKNVNIHRYKLSMLWVYTIILGVASMTFSSCSTHRAIRLRNKSIKKWESFQFQEIKKSPNNEVAKWIIYSRKIKGTSFLEYKIEGNIESTSKACFSAFRKDIHNQAADLNNEKYPTYDIVYESTDSLLTYVIHKEPFPLKNTEMSVRYIFFKGTENSTQVVEWEEAWNEASVPPLSKKIKRVQTFRGSWHFTPITNNISSAVNSVSFDPKKMPIWLVEPMVFKFLKEGLENMRAMTSK